MGGEISDECPLLLLLLLLVKMFIQDTFVMSDVSFLPQNTRTGILKIHVFTSCIYP